MYVVSSITFPECASDRHPKARKDPPPIIKQQKTDTFPKYTKITLAQSSDRRCRPTSSVDVQIRRNLRLDRGLQLPSLRQSKRLRVMLSLLAAFLRLDQSHVRLVVGTLLECVGSAHAVCPRGSYGERDNQFLLASLIALLRRRRGGWCSRKERKY